MPDRSNNLKTVQTLALIGMDFLCTKTAYKLGLSGPAVVVQTACSTSIVATVMACQSLLDFQCDVALAGGTAVYMPVKSGYLWQDGMIYSPDGHCRPFDAKAAGTIPGNGVGLVVLKRLEDALADHDRIYAVIRGGAINNDGNQKGAFTAPSVEGQAKVIYETMVRADVRAESIGYVEAHRTATQQEQPLKKAV